MLLNKGTPNKNRSLFACVFTSDYQAGLQGDFVDVTLLKLHEMKVVKA